MSNGPEARQSHLFAQIPNDLVRDPDADPFVIAAYCAISSRANSAQHAWPSYELMRKEAHQGNARLSKSLKWLEANGWLVITRRRNDEGHVRPNVYEVQGARLITPQKSLITPGELSEPDYASEKPDYASRNTSGVVEEEPSEEEEHLLRKSKRSKKQQLREEIFSAFWKFKTGETYSVDKVLTKSERGRINDGVEDAINAGIDSDEIRIRGDRYREAWPTMPFTAQALLTNWTTFADDAVEAACSHRWEDEGRTAWHTSGDSRSCDKCGDQQPASLQLVEAVG